MLTITPLTWSCGTPAGPTRMSMTTYPFNVIDEIIVLHKPIWLLCYGKS